jgi:hypothetical protein
MTWQVKFAPRRRTVIDPSGIDQDAAAVHIDRCQAMMVA